MKECDETLEQMKFLDTSKNGGDCLLLIYKTIDKLIDEKKYDDINYYINEFIKKDFSFLQYIGFLTITNMVKEFISERNKLYLNAIISGTKEMSEESAIKTLTGLE